MKRLNLITCVLLLLSALVSQAAERRVVVIFAQFQDLSFKYGSKDFSSFTDSLSMYFNAQYHGAATFRFDRGPVVTLSRAHSYYGNNTTSRNDALMYQGVEEACRLASDSLRFSDYSNGSATTVKDVLIMVPGMSEPNSGKSDLFWPQYVSLTDRGSNLVLDNRRITEYGLACELGPDGRFAGIGDMAHEYGHILGLKDLYDTDGEGSGGLSRALWGRFSLMDKGNTNNGGHTPPNFCAAELFTLGIGKGEEITKPGIYTLSPIEQEGRYFIFRDSEGDDVFLAECRQENGWDSHIGGGGLLIYHYDNSDGDALWSDYYSTRLTAAERWERNQINCNPAHQCVELEASATDYPFFPNGTRTEFTSETTPAFRFWNGADNPYAISAIRRNWDGKVVFRLVRPITITDSYSFQNSISIQWECDSGIAGDIDSCRVACYNGVHLVSMNDAEHNGPLSWGCAVNGLSPSTAYSLKIYLYNDGKVMFSSESSYTTLPERKGIFPFIYLNYAGRRPDGSFPRDTSIPLQVFNSTGARNIVWFYDNVLIAPGPDGRFTLQTSGTLQAEISWSDGSKDVITKKITVK